MENMLPDQDRTSQECGWNEVLRHEIIHAFFSESGLEKYSSDELLVEWLAVQIPKIVKTIALAITKIGEMTEDAD